MEPKIQMAIIIGDLVLQSINNYKGALKSITKAIAIEPKNLEYLLQKGFVLNLLGNFKEALKYYDDILEI